MTNEEKIIELIQMRYKMYLNLADTPENRIIRQELDVLQLCINRIQSGLLIG